MSKVVYIICNALERLAEEAGVQIHKGIDVTSIDTYFNQVIGVRLDNGHSC